MAKFKIMNYRYGCENTEASYPFKTVEPKVLQSLLTILADKDFFTRDELEQLIDDNCYIEEENHE